MTWKVSRVSKSAFPDEGFLQISENLHRKRNSSANKCISTFQKLVKLSSPSSLHRIFLTRSSCRRWTAFCCSETRKYVLNKFHSYLTIHFIFRKGKCFTIMKNSFYMRSKCFRSRIFRNNASILFLSLHSKRDCWHRIYVLHFFDVHCDAHAHMDSKKERERAILSSHWPEKRIFHLNIEHYAN